MQQKIRKCSNFDPQSYVCREVAENGDEMIYLPAYARLLWMNAYAAENDILFGFTSEREVSDVSGTMQIRATLYQYIGCGYYGNIQNGWKEITPVVLASCIASGKINDDLYGPEGVETRAQARCLRLAGFNVEVENGTDDFFEGSPADSPIITTAPFKPDLIEKETKTEDKDVEDNVVVEPQTKLSDFFPDMKKSKVAEKTEEEKLRFCLNECFYPWKQKDFDKGDLTRDICLKPNFVEKLQWILTDYVGDAEIATGLTIKEWAETLAKYLINPTDEARELLIKILKEKN